MMKRSDNDIRIRDEKAKQGAARYGEHLYHYTTFSALYNILKTKELWWGNMATMNDSKELNYFIDGLKQVLIEDFADKGEAIDIFFDDVKKKRGDNYPYSMCFSRLADDAAQWERYADSAKGVCIVFSTETLKKLFMFSMVQMNEAFYDTDFRKHDHYSILKYYIEKNTLNSFSERNGEIQNIIYTAVSHKHKSFFSENEVRLITFWHFFSKCFSCNEGYESFEVINGQIKKVLKINLERFCANEGVCIEDLFDGIVIGPRASQSKSVLADFCKSNGFNQLSAHISVSDCPLR